MIPNLEWLKPLLARYHRVVPNLKSPSIELVQSVNQLRLASAMIDKAELCQRVPDHAKQLVIVGPTQSGKSSLVNALLGFNATKTSALAGFTMHAQGFATGCTDEELDVILPLFTPFTRVEDNELTTERLDTFVLKNVTDIDQNTRDSTVYWDTPDFDSIDAKHYSQTVLRAIALADVLCLIVSKDKYGDKTVWDLLKLIAPLHKPTIVCINKLDAHDVSTVVNAFQSRWEAELQSSPIEPFTMPFIKRNSNDAQDLLLSDKELRDIRQAITQQLADIDRTGVARHTDQYVQLHQQTWLNPLREELGAKQVWYDLIDTVCLKTEERYVQEYLNNSAKYDTFSRALAELLTLLEIPGIASTLSRTREVVTWPVRKLFGLGQSVIKQQVSLPSASKNPNANQELDLLQILFSDCLIELQSTILDQPSNTVWLSLNKTLRDRVPDLKKEFESVSLQAQQAFEPQIEQAARELFNQLQTQPALLNTLRATRATADAAGIALTIKSGGLAAADLILAPAMLSVTSLLTESALGQYLEKTKRSLKEKQRVHFRSTLLQAYVVTRLRDMAEELDDQAAFTVNLEQELKQVLIIDN